MNHRFHHTFAIVASALIGFSGSTSAAANALADFGGKAKFIYTLPDKALAPKIPAPAAIKGENQAIQIKDWNDYNGVLDAVSR